MPTAEYLPRLAAYHDVLTAYERAWQTWQHDPFPRSFAMLETGIEILDCELAKPGKFELGQVLMTPGASKALLTAENERSLRVGSRLLSAYRTRTEEMLWIITEWDRSATTLLLPEEY